MNTRGFFFAALALLACRCAAPAAEKPNVLFIAVDDLNDWVGCLEGHPQVETPNIDRLAAAGTLFANAHCQAPLCNPSRASLLTGLRPTTTGIYALNPYLRTIPELKDIRTIPQYFSDHGYVSLGVGKVHHQGEVYGTNELYQGEFDIKGPQRSLARPLPPQKLVQTPVNWAMVDWGTFPHKASERADYETATWAIDHLAEESTDQPFFLCVGFFLPHLPCLTPPEWFARYPEDVALPPILYGDRADTPRASWYLHWDLPEPRLAWMDANDQTRNFVRSYLSCITFMDAQVGRLLNALESGPHAENTLIVLWSDHGYHLGEKEITGKNSLWDEATRVPLIFAGPGVSKGSVVRQPVELLDIYPTLVELAGLPAKSGLDGLSLVPQLRDPAAPRARPAITSAGGPGNLAVRADRYRYIVYADGSEEFYDLETDPNAWTNRMGDAGYDEAREELKRWLPGQRAEPVRDSGGRLSEYRDGAFYWDGEPVPVDAPIPGIQAPE